MVGGTWCRFDGGEPEGRTPLSYISAQQEYVQRELFFAVLKGLSESVGGFVSVADALEHSNQYRLNSWTTQQQIHQWKQTMKFDPFAKIREYCGIGLHTEYDGKPTLAAQLQALEKKICEHGCICLVKKWAEHLKIMILKQ